MPRSTVTTRTAAAISAAATRAIPAAVSSSERPSSSPSGRSARSAASRSSRTSPASGESGVEPAQQQVGVGDRGLLAAAPVARRPRVGARRARAHAQGAARVAPGDRAAAGADRVHVDHRQRERAAAHLAPVPDRRRAAADQRHVAGGAAHVEPHRVAAGRAAPRPPRRRPGPTARSRSRGAPRLARRAVPPLESITSGSGSPASRGPLGQAREVAAQQRRQRGVHDGRGAALVLAEHARGLVRGRHVHVAERLRRQLGHAPLVVGVAKAPEQADRGGLAVDVRRAPRAARPRRAPRSRRRARCAPARPRAARPARAAAGGPRRAGRARRAPGGPAPRGR